MSDEPDNPFKGTPFEAMFQQFSGAAGAGGAPDLNAIFAQVQQLLSGSGDGKPVNWDLAKDIARKTVAAAGDRSITPTDSDRVSDAVRLAEHWLDEATTLPEASTTSAAWSRAEWVENTLPVWQTIVDPVAEHVAGAMGNALPAEAQQLAGPMAGMLRQLGGSIFGAQVGQGLGELAGEVVSSSDIGLPLGPTGQAVLLPDNVAKFAEGLGLTDEDVRLYLALREVAHQRLYAGVPCLRQHVLSAVADYAAGIEVDTGKIESAMADIDPQNPESMQEALAGGLFEPEDSEQQKAALVRLETTSRSSRAGWTTSYGRQPRTGCRPRFSLRRRYDGAGPLVVRRSRRSRRWLGCNCGRGDCGMRRTCGLPYATREARTAATSCGRTRTSCQAHPTSTTRSASPSTPANWQTSTSATSSPTKTTPARKVKKATNPAPSSRLLQPHDAVRQDIPSVRRRFVDRSRRDRPHRVRLSDSQ